MEQKYYVAEKGSWYLSITKHSGTLTEWDIIDNIERMMMLEAEESQRKRIRKEAIWFYHENIERIMQMVREGQKLKAITQEEAEEYLTLTFSEWEQSEFPQTEWD